MHYVAQTLLALLTLSAALLQAASAHAPQPQQADPSLIRLYRCHELGEDGLIQDRGRDGKPLRLVLHGDARRQVPGRLPGTTAVRLDRAQLVAAPFDLTSRQFTAQAWVRLLKPGHHRGNGGSTNATILSIGIGYWDGWRMTTGFPDPSLNFELGRPRGINAFGLRANQGPAPAVWQHVACSWDGKTMRLYLNGRIIRQAAYDAPYTHPDPKAPFIVGFAGHGIGSALMDVDEIAIHNRALSPAEIASQMLSETLPARSDHRDLNDLLTAHARGEKPQLDTLKRLLARPLGQNTRTWLRLYAAEHFPLHFPLPLDIDDIPALPEFLRGLLEGILMNKLVSQPGGDYPQAILNRLLQRDSLPDSMRLAILKHTLQVHLKHGRSDLAQATFKDIDAIPGANTMARLDLHLDFAHALRRHGHYQQARNAYDKAATLAVKTEQEDHAPALFRGIARLGAAQTFLLEQRHEDAITAFQAIAADSSLLPHHRQEAAEMAAETKRQTAGLPPREPQKNRTTLPLPAVPKLAVHVAPTGDDRHDGSAQHPVQTPQRALQLLRERRQQAPVQPAALVLHGGTYHVSAALELNEADSGQPGAPFIIMAAPGETPVLHGGLRLTELKPETNPEILAKLPPGQHVELFSCDLPDTCRENLAKTPQAELFCNGEPLTPARYPNTGFIKTGTSTSNKERSFDCPEPRLQRWLKAPDVWVTGYWRHLWAVDTYKIARIQSEPQRVTLATLGHYGLAPNMPFFAFNLLEELDQPGEWFLDRTNAKLYLYPKLPLNSSTLELSTLKTPFITAPKLSHAIIHGLTFAMTQSDAVVIRNAEHLQFSANTVRQAAGYAIVIARARKTQIYGNDFHTLGKGGVHIYGGNRKTLEPGQVNIENNHFRNFSRIVRSYTPAIFLDGVGNRIAYNLMHDAPHHAIRLEGNDHLVEFNEIHSVVYESDDQSGIDMWSNPSYRGNVIRYNFWHHIGSGRNVAGQAGIRLDDAICGVLMYSNIFLRAADGGFGAIQIHGGNDNIVDNNLFIDCQAAVSFSSWGNDTWQRYLKNNKAKFTTQVDISQPPYSVRYPRAAKLLHDFNAVNYVSRSVLVRCPTFILRQRPQHVLGANTSPDDARAFHTRSTHEGYLQAFTPEAWQDIMRTSDVRPIPFAEIGLYPDAARASVPDPATNRRITPHYHGLDAME